MPNQAEANIATPKSPQPAGAGTVSVDAPVLSAEERDKLIYDNNQMLLELVRLNKHIRRIQITKLVISILFIVLPVILSLFLLPSLISQFSEIYGGAEGYDALLEVYGVGEAVER